MLLELVVNDGPFLRASLNRKGWLSAHLNVTIGADEKDDATMSLTSVDQTDEPNAVYSTWEAGKLSVGDKVEIRPVAVGEADPQTTVRRSSESPRNLFPDADQARRLLTAINAFDAELMGVIERARAAEPKEESDRIAKAIGAVLVEMDQRLISPTLRSHPELLKEQVFKKLWM